MVENIRYPSMIGCMCNILRGNILWANCKLPNSPNYVSKRLVHLYKCRWIGFVAQNGEESVSFIDIALMDHLRVMRCGGGGKETAEAVCDVEMRWRGVCVCDKEVVKGVCV